MRKVVIFNYDSKFAERIAETVRRFNFSVDMRRAVECPTETVAGSADIIIHSGGDGTPVKEDMAGAPKLYICHSHQWKARQNGGEVVKLKELIKGVKDIDVVEDNDILGKKGKMPIMQYHILAVTRAPACGKVLAVSKAVDIDGKEREIIEALQYPDGSISIQGHPEEGAAGHVIYNFFERWKRNGT